MDELKIEYDTPSPTKEKTKSEIVFDAVIDFAKGTHSSIEIDMETKGKAGYYIGTVKRALRRLSAERDGAQEQRPSAGTYGGFKVVTIGTKIRVERMTNEDD